MPKIIFTSRYLRDAPPAQLENYVRYISTRDGVEKIDESKLNLPATKNQMLMSPDELKTLPKGQFILAKTGCCPMQITLPLFLKWGIQFEEAYEIPKQAARTVAYVLL